MTGVRTTMMAAAIPMFMNATVVPGIGRWLTNLRRYPIATPYDDPAMMQASWPYRSPVSVPVCHGPMTNNTPVMPMTTPTTWLRLNFSTWKTRVTMTAVAIGVIEL